MDKESMYMQMVQVMKVVGKMISKMDWDMKCGQMEPVIKELIYRVKRKDMAYLNGRMDHIMRANFWIMQFMVWGLTFGEMEEPIQDNGDKTKCMDLENLNGQMEGDTKDLIKMIRNKVMELLIGVNLFIIYIADGSKYVGEWHDGK